MAVANETRALISHLATAGGCVLLLLNNYAHKTWYLFHQSFTRDGDETKKLWTKVKQQSEQI